MGLLWSMISLLQLRLVIEIIWPLCLFLVLVAVRHSQDLKIFQPECEYIFCLFDCDT